ncbi:hypothetical protein BO71DRAFT_25112 [Aspergillus ellipticus CBS 707.79]|uniref:Uncharacterized protein n=1 Tax=Aspergillus ellipticus CBS 707.79 TaxID=1448320 RepID=A0A319DWA2_9EURO|nr:hypothetical protein BO71DRAFT_25112 [Aspergillus ellipticus CBS 707.79]
MCSQPLRLGTRHGRQNFTSADKVQSGSNYSWSLISIRSKEYSPPHWEYLLLNRIPSGTSPSCDRSCYHGRRIIRHEATDFASDVRGGGP